MEFNHERAVVNEVISAPHHYTESYVNRMIPHIPYKGYVNYETLFGTFDGAASHLEEVRIKILLAGINTLAPDSALQVYPIVRAEFFRLGNGLDRRGVILFDSRLKPVLHVQHALLGYQGSGPHLSEVILKTLGGDANFSDVNELVNYDRPYMVIFSREKITEVAGVKAASPFDEPLEQWKWWQAQV